MSDESGDLLSTLAPLLSGVRFGKFVSVGAIGFAFDTAVLVTLKLGVGVPELWAKAAAIETAIVVMFLVNEHWTFAGEGLPGRVAFLRRLARSHVVRAGGSTVQFVIYWLLTQQLAYTMVLFGVDWWFLLASPVAVGIAMLVNYLFESLFTWRIHRNE